LSEKISKFGVKQMFGAKKEEANDGKEADSSSRLPAWKQTMLDKQKTQKPEANTNSEPTKSTEQATNASEPNKTLPNTSEPIKSEPNTSVKLEEPTKPPESTKIEVKPPEPVKTVDVGKAKPINHAEPPSSTSSEPPKDPEPAPKPAKPSEPSTEPAKQAEPAIEPKHVTPELNSSPTKATTSPTKATISPTKPTEHENGYGFFNYFLFFIYC
jgi:hypothetical protein